MNQRPISRSQKEYIESLCAQLGYSTRFALSEGLNIIATPLHQLDREEASELIDWLKEEQRK